MLCVTLSDEGRIRHTTRGARGAPFGLNASKRSQLTRLHVCFELHTANYNEVTFTMSRLGVVDRLDKAWALGDGVGRETAIRRSAPSTRSDVGAKHHLYHHYHPRPCLPLGLSPSSVSLTGFHWTATINPL